MPPATRIPSTKTIKTLLLRFTIKRPRRSNIRKLCRIEAQVAIFVAAIVLTQGEVRGTSHMSELFPATTDDERDPREDQSDARRREDEIKGDKPPHHDE